MNYKNIELPDGLREKTINFITNLIDTFDREGKLNKIDNMSIYILAGNMDMYLDCEEEIQKSGIIHVSDRGNHGLSPYVVQQRSVQLTIMNILKEFGCTQYSRGKMRVVDNNDESPLADFFSK